MSHPTTAAPGRLELVRQFVNTNDLDQDIDALSDPAGLASWVQSNGLLPGPAAVDPDDVARAKSVREALREAMAANHAGDPIPPASLDVLNAAAREGQLVTTLTADAQSVIEPGAAGISGVIGALLAIVIDASRDDTWSRLKVCTNDECRWAFYDHSRARSGKWCSMGACGNRAKQRAWRERQGEPTPQVTPGVSAPKPGAPQ